MSANNQPERELMHDSEEEEQDEFVVIKQQDSSPDLLPHEEGRESPVCYVEKSQPASEYGPLADVGSGLDCGQSMASSPFEGSRRPSGQMTSSMVSETRSQAILDSMYNGMAFMSSMYGPQLGDTNQVEKLVEVLKGESEKNRTVLDQIYSMISDLSQEKTNSNELRQKLAASQKELEQQEKMNKEIEATLAEFKIRINKDAEERKNLLDSLGRLSKAHSAKDTEVDRLEHSLHQLALENDQLKQALEEAKHELEHKRVESSNQAEIINVLQEENVETHQLVESTRKRYRERLDYLEQQVASYHDRNEVNFP